MTSFCDASVDRIAQHAQLIVPLLDDSEGPVRRAAVSVLAKSQSAPVIEAIARRLEDDDAMVRCAAVKALGAAHTEREVRSSNKFIPTHSQ